ncbi:MAG: hypothetical protein ABIO29_01915 [Sphingomicrobium sp.]
MIAAAVLVPAAGYSEPHQWAYDVEAEALRRGGFAVVPRPWNEPGELAGFDVVLPLVAWGYQSHPARWFKLLDRLDAQAVNVINPVPLLRWNSDKRYLEELAAKGITTVPTRLVERLNVDSIASARGDFGDHLVVKPPISASAYGTHRLGPGDAIPADAMDRPMMVQPFLRSVMDEGEYSLVFFDGKFSHALVKNAKAGDYRVQPHLGGSEVQCPAPVGGVALATAALAAAPSLPAYARVDLIRLDDGQLAVIELELIEPSLWLQHAPDGGASFAAAVARRVGQ